MAAPVTLARLNAALLVVADRLADSLEYAPIFDRLEAQIALEEAKADPHPVTRARRMIEARRSLDAFMTAKEAA